MVVGERVVQFPQPAFISSSHRTLFYTYFTFKKPIPTIGLVFYFMNVLTKKFLIFKSIYRLNIFCDLRCR